jgi:hypothetical protein
VQECERARRRLDVVPGIDLGPISHVDLRS